MYDVLIIDITGKIITKNIIDDNYLYKCCNYRNNNGFHLIHKWSLNNSNYELYGKNKGIKKNINNIKLQDIDILYGKILILKKNSNNILESISLSEWENVHNSIENNTYENIEINDENLKYEEYEKE